MPLHGLVVEKEVMQAGHVLTVCEPQRKYLLLDEWTPEVFACVLLLNQRSRATKSILTLLTMKI